MIVLLNDADPNVLGFLPGIFDRSDPRRARDQANIRYAHGGGWRPMKNFEVVDGRLAYPGDPPLHPVAAWKLRDELIILYEHAFVAIVQEDGSFEVARLD